MQLSFMYFNILSVKELIASSNGRWSLTFSLDFVLNSVILQLQRLKQESSNNQAKVNSLEEELTLARRTSDAWRCKAIMAEQQREEVGVSILVSFSFFF